MTLCQSEHKRWGDTTAAAEEGGTGPEVKQSGGRGGLKC